MINEINKLRKELADTNPLIHSITNPISITGCANAALAAGARPIMAEHPGEVREITVTCDALVLNLGNITDVRMESMLISADVGKPCVIDLVGIACSSLRRSFAKRLIEKNPPLVLKGNYSEINALFDSGYKSAGVDSEKLTADYISSVSVKLARKFNAVILASGGVDVVTDGNRLFHIKNGTPRLSEITGTGCMLGMLCGCFAAVRRDIISAVTACAVLGISGELAQTTVGNGSFSVRLFDSLSVLSDEDIKKHLNMEEIKIEEI